MNKVIEKYPIYLVALWGIILFFPFLGAVHLFDWDEINFAESAREMIVSGNFLQVQINFQPFIEKPPLFFWLQVLSMKLFGINEFAARFPNAIVGVVVLVSVFYIAAKHFDKRYAFFWVMFITGSFTPHLYFKSGIIDPLYNLFIFAAVYQLFLYVSSENKSLHSIYLGILIGLAVITKGPVAIIILLLCFTVFWALKKFSMFFKIKHVLITFLSGFVISFAWFGLETINNGPLFIVEFIKYQIDLFLNPVAGHGQPFWYHPLVLLFGAFPASVIAIPQLLKSNKNFNQKQFDFVRLMQILFWVTLILFSIVKTKIVHYSSLCYLPLTFLASVYIINVFETKTRLGKWQIFLLACIGILLGFLFSVITLIDLIKEQIIPYIKDDFAIGNLSIDSYWKGYEIFTGIFLLVIVVVSIIQLNKNKILTGLLLLLLGISIFIPVYLRIVVPHIEAYSQRSAIEFYKNLQGKDCYVETVGFKSYAQYFYTKVQIHQNSNYKNLQWLMNGNLDKPAYFVLKEGNLKDHINPTMHELYRKGGFVFFMRNAGETFIGEQTEQK